VGETPWRFKSSHPHDRYKQARGPKRFVDWTNAHAREMGVSHIGGMIGALGPGVDLDAALEARINMLRALETVAIERDVPPETLAAIRELLLEAEAEQ
jgi:hypothetical protein